MKTKMKKGLFAALACSLFFSGGCIGENLENCPEPRNVFFDFIYPDETDQDIFGQRVQKVELLIFDEAGNYICHESIPQEQLVQFAGTQMYLPPGTYRIVGWGNVLENARLDEPHPEWNVDNISVSHNHDGSDIVSGYDPLHYAPRRCRENPSWGASGPNPDRLLLLEVPQQGSIHETIRFTCAHTVIDLVVKDWDDRDGVAPNEPPHLELTGVPAEYSFLLDTEGTIRYRKTASYKRSDEENEAHVQFYSALLDENDDVGIQLLHPVTDEVLMEIDLTEFLQKNNIDLYGMFEPQVTVIIDFPTGTVTVKVNDWSGTEIFPIR